MVKQSQSAAAIGSPGALAQATLISIVWLTSCRNATSLAPEFMRERAQLFCSERMLHVELPQHSAGVGFVCGLADDPLRIRLAAARPGMASAFNRVENHVGSAVAVSKTADMLRYPRFNRASLTLVVLRYVGCPVGDIGKGPGRDRRCSAEARSKFVIRAVKYQGRHRLGISAFPWLHMCGSYRTHGSDPVRQVAR